METIIKNKNLQALAVAIMNLPGACITPIHASLPENKMLMNALEVLTPAMKFVLVEKFVLGKSVKEFASENGYSVSTAKL